MIQLIRGFKDILPGEVEVWQHVEKITRALFEDFGFTEIRTPILERTELFKRSIGEETDIVEKEMYTFPDRKGDLITLRPEATASVVRSYIQHKMYATDPVRKLYTIGPMFRRERPQKGRYRQFYQINAEVFGVTSPLMDAQVILLITKLFERLSIPDVKAHVNSLGCPECRPKFNKALEDVLESVKDKLCEDCTRRSGKNPMRTLDCKVPSCREALSDAPSISDFLCTECRNHFETFISSLEKMDIPFKVDKRLVRGLDYYTRTTFEIQTEMLGAQNAVAGGGRDDGLVKALGGPEQPAIGFGVGFERLIDIAGLNVEDFINKPSLYIAALGDRCVSEAFNWQCLFNLEGIRTEMDLGGKSLKSQMKRADRLDAMHVLIFGENELESGFAILRNMKTKEQTEISINNIIDNIKKLI